jgi:hypothetical protein
LTSAFFLTHPAPLLFLGHASHVDGIAGGAAYGVAKLSNLVAVINGSGRGTLSGLIAGVDYVAARKKENPAQPIVASRFKFFQCSRGMEVFQLYSNTALFLIFITDLSLGGGPSSSINDAVNKAVEAGAVFTVSAGNDGNDACLKSPASASGSIAVGATGRDNIRAGYSNYGSCVNIFA